MHIIETASFGARAAGRLINRPALGTTIHHSLFTGSRFFLVLLLPILGYLIESGISVDSYSNIIVLSLLLTFICSLIVLFRFNYIQHFFQKIFVLYKDSSIPIAFFKSFFKAKQLELSFKDIEKLSVHKLIFKKMFVSFVAYTFLGTGFFISFYLALSFPEYRLTLSQFTAVFHGFGAIIVSFYLDPMLSRSIDQIDNDTLWLNNLYSILVGRVISYLFASIIFFIFYIINSSI